MSVKAYTENGKKLFEVYVHGIDPKGKRFQKRRVAIETEAKARALEFEFKRELANRKDAPVSFSWREWTGVCFERMKFENRPSTLINYQKMLGKWVDPYFSEKEIGKISRSEVYEVLYQGAAQKLTPWSRKTLLKMVRRIFSMAVDDGRLDRNPTAGLQIKIADVDQKVLTTNEVDLFLKEARALGHRFYPIWALALFTGMRSGELFALQWTDVDLDSKIISVTKQWTSKNGISPTKTQRSRVVPISTELSDFLKELKIQRRQEAAVLPQLWEWSQGEQARITKEFCISLGITPIKFHDLRATFITNLLSKGVALAKVMAIVGHNQLKTTNGYLRRAGIELQGATEALGYALPQAYQAKVIELKKS